MKKSKDIFILLFLVLAALVVGGLVSELTDGISGLKWLTYGTSIGFNHGNAEPLINLSVIKLSFGFEMKISVLQVILISTALLLYRKVK